MANSGIDGYPGSESDSNNSGGGTGGSGERFRGEWDMSILTPQEGIPPVSAELISNSQLVVTKNSNNSYNVTTANNSHGSVLLEDADLWMASCTTALPGFNAKNGGIKTMRITNPQFTDNTIQQFFIIVHDTSISAGDLFSQVILTNNTQDPTIFYILGFTPHFQGVLHTYNSITAVSFNTLSGSLSSPGQISVSTPETLDFAQDIYFSVDFTTGNFIITTPSRSTVQGTSNITLLDENVNFSVSIVFYYASVLDTVPDINVELDVSDIDVRVTGSHPFMMGNGTGYSLLLPSDTQDGDIFVALNPTSFNGNAIPQEGDFVKITNNLQTLIPWYVPQTDEEIGNIANAKITEQLFGQGTIATGIIDTINGQLEGGGSIRTAIEVAISEAGGGNTTTMLPTQSQYYFNPVDVIHVEAETQWDANVSVPTLYTEITIEFDNDSSTDPCYVLFNNFTIENYPLQTIFKINIVSAYDITVIFQTETSQVINEIVISANGMITYLFSVLSNQNINDNYISFIGKYLNIVPSLRSTIYEITYGNSAGADRCVFNTEYASQTNGILKNQSGFLDLLYDGFSSSIFQIENSIPIQYFSADGNIAWTTLPAFSVTGRASISIDRPSSNARGTLEKISIVMYEPANVQGFTSIIKLGTLGTSQFSGNDYTGLSVRLTLGNVVDTFELYHSNSSNNITKTLHSVTVPSPVLNGLTSDDIYNIEFDFESGQVNIYSQYHYILDAFVPVGILHFDQNVLKASNINSVLKLGLLLKFSSSTPGIATLRISNGGNNVNLGSVKPFFYLENNNNLYIDYVDGDEIIISTQRYKFDNKIYKQGDVIKLYNNKTKALLSGTTTEEVHIRTHIITSEGFIIPQNAKSITITGISGANLGSSSPILFFPANPLHDTIIIRTTSTTSIVVASLIGAQFNGYTKVIDFVANVDKTFTIYRHPSGYVGEDPSTWY